MIKQITISLQWIELIPKYFRLSKYNINPVLTDKYFSWLFVVVHIEYNSPKTDARK